MNPLSELRLWYPDESDDADSINKHLRHIADEIQRYIDEYFLKKPLFDDGKPVQFGDRVFGTQFPVGKYTYFEDGRIFLSSKGDAGFCIAVFPGDTVRHHEEEKDTLADILADADEFAENCQNMSYDEARKEIFHLLDRQGKLDENGEYIR